MEPDFSLHPMTAETRPIVERFWQLYRHDLSEFRGTLPDEHGVFALGHLLPFFADEADRGAYLFYSGANPVGFTLLVGLASEPRVIYEFFVVRAARRQGIARSAVLALFALHPGTWEIAFQENNVAAARFWRRLTASVAGDAVREEPRPVPNKPHIPPDVWLTLTVGESGNRA